MENAEEIIVYASFDSAIDGSLAKAKLDAFGIPCFLTEENMSALYPGQQNFAIQVRLHIFKKDIEEVSGILMNVESTHDAADLRCPKCSSKKIEREFPKRLLLEPISSVIVMFFGVFFPEKKVSHCLDCDNEF
jgi:DNA-directed RNA polymerase subunit RPC12/RpoP